MATLKLIDRVACSLLRESINDALGEVRKHWGVHATIGRMKFTPSQVGMRPEITIKDPVHPDLTPEAITFKANAHFYGLTPEDLGREIMTPRGVCKIAGLRIRSVKYPIVGMDHGGRRFKFSALFAKEALRREIPEGS